MPSETSAVVDSAPYLYPQQVCYVVDDVPAAVDYCSEWFGWGPFQQFKAPVDNASYRDWTGHKLVEVALGMAGRVQVEFIHVHEGHDSIEAYQAEYSIGFQHLGISCQSREEAVTHLESLGAKVNELNEYPGIRFAFVNVPTGPAMFELLQRTDAWGTDEGLNISDDASAGDEGVLTVDRATIVTSNMDETLRFYAGAFGWSDTKAATATLGYGDKETTAKRFIGKAGTLQLELIEPQGKGDDPYSAHLARGQHGLIHAGGPAARGLADGAALQCEWLEDKELFALYDWPGGKRSLQVRHVGQ